MTRKVSVAIRGVGWDLREAMEALTLPATFKETPKNSGIKIKNILMPHFFKILINSNSPMMTKR